MHLKKTRTYCILLGSLIALIISCANPIPPGGGPRDEQPPRLIEKGSSQQMQTQFDDDELKFEFDEYIQLDKPTQQIIISPPLQFRPSYIARGKTLIVRFDRDEILEVNTTYTIQFGNAVKDFTEGNSVENFRYVFSTGTVIDSLSFTCRLRNSKDGSTVKNAWVILYPGKQDSAVFREMPYYFSKTDSSGKATLENLKEGEYTLIALQDMNENYMYDLPGEEQIGFYQNLVNLPDSINNYTIEMFLEQPKPFLESVDQIYPGKYLLTLSGQRELIQWQPELDRFMWFSENDSISIWAPGDKPDQILVALFEQDTIGRISWPERLENNEVPLAHIKDKRIVFRANQPSSINFNLPVELIREEGVYGTDSSGRVYRPTINSTNLGPGLSFDVQFSGNHPDSIFVEQGTFRDIYGREVDEMSIPVKSFSAEQLSTVFLKIENLDSTRQYILEVYQDEKVYLKTVFSNVSNWETTLGNIQVRTYDLRVIEDRNRNGFYDHGHYLRKSMPERITNRKITNLRPNWDQEIIVTFSN